MSVFINLGSPYPLPMLAYAQVQGGREEGYKPEEKHGLSNMCVYGKESR